MKPTIQIDSQQKTVVIAFNGDLNSTMVREFRTEIDHALAVPPGGAAWQTITLDLQSAKMVDSMGLNLVVKIFKCAQPAGTRVRLVYSDPNVHRTLIFTRLDQHLELVKA